MSFNCFHFKTHLSCDVIMFSFKNIFILHDFYFIIGIFDFYGNFDCIIDFFVSCLGMGLRFYKRLDINVLNKYI